MFKITKDDLTKKTDAQLAALFQQATIGLSATKADRAAVSNGQQERMIELPKEGQDVKDAGQAPA